MNNDNAKKKTVADLLRDCPAGTELYTPLLGVGQGCRYNLTLLEVDDDGTVECMRADSPGIRIEFHADGSHYGGGECMVWPSRFCRNWGVFRAEWFEATGDASADGMLIAALLERGGGAERVGDVTVAGHLWYIDAADGVIRHTDFVLDKDVLRDTGREVKPEEEEKKAEKEDGPACPFRPFDRVLVRDDMGIWRADFFEMYNPSGLYPYGCIGGDWYERCIPYNDETAHLIGTTDDWKEGE